jgi:hypothetical protein
MILVRMVEFHCLSKLHTIGGVSGGKFQALTEKKRGGYQIISTSQMSTLEKEGRGQELRP